MKLKKVMGKISDEEFFKSPNLRNLLVRVIRSMTKKSVNLNLFDSGDFVAYTNNHDICYNINNSLVEGMTREDKYDMMKGIILHEVGHILFTDFHIMAEFSENFLKRKWFPFRPKVSSDLEKYLKEIEDFLAQDDLNIKLFYSIAKEVDNIIEDGFMEEAVIETKTGSWVEGLFLVRDIHFKSIPTVSEMVSNPQPPFLSFLNLMLSYAKFGEFKYDDPSDLKTPIVEQLKFSMPYINKALDSWNPIDRRIAVNEVLISIWPLMKDYLEEVKANSKSPSGAQSKVGNDMSKASPSSIPTGRNLPSKTSHSKTSLSKKRTKTTKMLGEEQKEAEKSNSSNEEKESSPENKTSDNSKEENKANKSSKGEKDDSSKENDSKNSEGEKDDSSNEDDSKNSEGEKDDSSNEDDSESSEGEKDDSSNEDDSESSEGENDNSSNKDDSNGEKQEISSEEKGRIPLKDTKEISTADDLDPEVDDSNSYDSIIQENTESAIEIDRILKEMANEMVKKNEEEELLRQLKKTISQTNFGAAHRGVPVRINRIESIPDSYIPQYQSIAKPLLAISKRLQKQISQQLEDFRVGGKINGLYYGRKFNSARVARNDGKYFYNKKLPNDIPLIAVGLLLDESGSMSGNNRAVVARSTAIIIHDFCLKLGIPVCIYGHTADQSRNCVDLYSYAEFDHPQTEDSYRLMDVSSRCCNRDGCALKFMYDKLSRRPEDTKILIIVSDGQPYATGYSGTAAEKDIQTLKSSFDRKGIKTFAAAIGSDKEKIKRIYQDGFLDVSNLNNLPSILTKLIVKNIHI